MLEGGGLVYLELVVQRRSWNVEIDAEEIFRIGRAPINTVALTDDLVSRYHAVIQRTEGDRYLLADLGSQNGTFVNSMRITAPMALSDGDRITIGSHVFVFHNPNGSSEAGTQPTLGTQRLLQMRPVSVLVMDIHDFTEMWTQEPAGISEAMVAFNKDVGKLLTEQRVWSQKYSGDGVMAVWLHEDEGEAESRDVQRRIIRSATGIADLASRLPQRFSLPFDVRIGAGVDSGPAFMGNIGSPANADYSALGEAVNRAFRIEAVTRTIGCDIALGRDTYRQWRQILPAARFMEHRVNLKGFPRPETVYACAYADLLELTAARSAPVS